MTSFVPPPTSTSSSTPQKTGASSSLADMHPMLTDWLAQKAQAPSPQTQAKRTRLLQKLSSLTSNPPPGGSKR